MSKITSADCLAHLVKTLSAHPELVQNQMPQLVGDAQIEKWRNVLWPACVDESAWVRTATLRPSRKQIEEAQNNTARSGTNPFFNLTGYGSDAEIRVYENEAWYPKLLKAEVLTEHGDIKDVRITLS